jgi:hypothetical protein
MTTNLAGSRLRVSVSPPDKKGHPVYLWSVMTDGKLRAGVNEWWQDPVLTAIGTAVKQELGDRRCTIRRAHPAHSWWSRKNQGYFNCPGRS